MGPDQPTSDIGETLNEVPYFREVSPFHDWMFEMIRPYLLGRILEIGSGLGDFASLFMKYDIPIHLSDIDNHSCEILGNRFESTSIIRRIHNIDLCHPEFAQIYSRMFGVFDLIFSLNIAKQTPIDPLAASNAQLLLRKGGRLILLIPSHTILFNELDQELQDLKRYNYIFSKKLLNNCFELRKIWYFKWITALKPTVTDKTGLYLIIVGRKKEP